MLVVLLAAVAGMLAVGPAGAAPPAKAAPEADVGVHLSRMTMGYTYFNRPGATATEHDAEVKACAAEASWTRSYDEVINKGAGMGIAGALIRGALADAA